MPTLEEWEVRNARHVQDRSRGIRPEALRRMRREQVRQDTQPRLSAGSWVATILLSILIAPIMGVCGAFAGGLATNASTEGMVVGAIVCAGFAIVAIAGAMLRSQEDEEIRQYKLAQARRQRRVDNR